MNFLSKICNVTLLKNLQSVHSADTSQNCLWCTWLRLEISDEKFGY